MTRVDKTMGSARDRDLSEYVLDMLQDGGWYVSCISEEMGESESVVMACVKKLRAAGLVDISKSREDSLVTLAES